ncbi:hypothetical protein GQ457_13G011140 [Hibiscus cannabinus]
MVSFVDDLFCCAFLFFRVKLDEVNFLLWKQQVLLMENGEKTEDEEYELYVAQDNTLASQLLTTTSPHLLPQFAGVETSAAVRKTVNKLLASKSSTTVMNLHYKLRSLRKGDLTMQTYISNVKEVCDSIASCGCAMGDIEHIATILNGLPIEYKPFVVVITACREPFTVDGVTTILTGGRGRGGCTRMVVLVVW